MSIENIEVGDVVQVIKDFQPSVLKDSNRFPWFTAGELGVVTRLDHGQVQFDHNDFAIPMDCVAYIGKSVVSPEAP